MSSAATKCHVGRRTWVRRISPPANARSTAASSWPRTRSPSDHFASANSWAWTAPSERTTSTGFANGLSVRP